MATFHTLQEIRAWDKARSLIKDIYSISGNGPFARDFGLRDQIRRASVSIASNIAEGFERDGNPEFIQFLSLAKGSAGEVQTQLQIAFDLGYLDESVFSRCYETTVMLGRMLGNLMNYLRNAQVRGKKFKLPLG